MLGGRRVRDTLFGPFAETKMLEMTFFLLAFASAFPTGAAAFRFLTRQDRATERQQPQAGSAAHRE